MPVTRLALPPQQFAPYVGIASGALRALAKFAVLKELVTLLDLCVSSLRRGHANLLCIVPILTDDPRRESKIAHSDLCLRSCVEAAALVCELESRWPPSHYAQSVPSASTMRAVCKATVLRRQSLGRRGWDSHPREQRPMDSDPRVQPERLPSAQSRCEIAIPALPDCAGKVHCAAAPRKNKAALAHARACFDGPRARMPRTALA